MIRRRYRIEASLSTLRRFIDTAEKIGRGNSFILKLRPDANEEYYYVDFIGVEECHKALKKQRFDDSIPLPTPS